MITDRNKLNFVTICGCLCLWAATAAVVNGLTIQQQQQSQSQQQQQQQLTIDEAKHEADVAGFEAGPRVLNPRMDYNNEWRPVGRGDPLKNDPTYDYSPPALERVRYWADSGDAKDGENDHDSSSSNSNGKNDGNKSNNSHKGEAKKNEVLLLGQAQERVRPKGEAPLVQPKYTSIRRSYYAHQLPTRLMPPPMHANMMMMSMVKPAPVSGDYRHNNVVSSSSSAPAPASAMHSMHSKPPPPHYSTSSWTHHQPMHGGSSSSPSPMSSYATHSLPSHSGPGSSFGSGSGSFSGSVSMAVAPHHHHPSMSMASHGHDSHHEGSVNYLTYTRPSTAYTMDSSHSSYASSSPNGIRPSQNALKPGAGQRKPWLHELLQKEVIKPARPTIPATKYLMGTTKPYYEGSSHGVGISTTYAPVSFVGSMAATTTTTRRPMMSYTPSPVYVTTTPVPMPTPPAILTSTARMPATMATRTTTTMTMTTARRPTATTTTTTTASPYHGNRLLIPTTSNLAFRPTVAPLEMTTDSLFSHYNQPEKPLVGPMYLIIEGHSKVKTYGKNELDPHQPKIVPIIPKREPIVRVADPNQRNRGTVETFQVKHLHTKTTPTATSTTAPPTTTAATTTTRPAATTVKPTTSKPTTTKSTTAKPPASKPTASKPATSKPTTAKPTTAKPTTSKPTTLKSSMGTKTTTTMTPKAPTNSVTTIRTTASFRPTIPPTKASSTVLTMVEKAPAQAQAPTGMQGLLSLLDGIFQDEPSAYGTPSAEPGPKPAAKVEQKKKQTQNFVTTRPPKPQEERLEARIGSQSDTIAAANEDYDESEVEGATTEPLPREVRQVYDYDDLPESRLKQLLDESYEDGGEAWMKSVYDDEYEDENEAGQRIKRIDKVMDYEEDAEEDDDENDDQDDEEEEDDENVEGANEGVEEDVQSPPLRKA